MCRNISIVLFIMTLFLPTGIKAQLRNLETEEDKKRYGELQAAMGRCFFRKPDSVLFYAYEAMALADKYGNYPVKNIAMQLAGETYRGKSDFPKSLDMQFSALKENRLHNDITGEAVTNSFISFTLAQLGQYRQSIDNMLPFVNDLASSMDWAHIAFMYSNLCQSYLGIQNLDSARYYHELSVVTLAKANGKRDWATREQACSTLVHTRAGNLLLAEGKLDSALQAYKETIDLSIQFDFLYNAGTSMARMATIFEKKGEIDSALFYAEQVVNGLKFQAIDRIEAADILARHYRKYGPVDSFIVHFGTAATLRDSIFGQKKLLQMQTIMLQDQQRRVDYELQQVKKEETQRMIQIGVVVLALIGFLVYQYRNILQKRKANQELSNALHSLKSTQAQLIQSEKMASLGELTAGIAHEIQNPLNFVNNFSEINADLTDEISEALEKDDKETIRGIVEDIKLNQQRINEHGKRAESIVKGMLQHSRSGSGIKEPTNLNALADEYLRLAFHGLRAKDKNFNSNFTTELDPTLGKVNVVPQDIGRVLLNLINNAFYTVNERSKTANGYEPIVTVRTKKTGQHAELTVTDNGNGIPENIKNKIFQPFFTTKPTGSGTGLGLSLCYDIVKAHGGEIRVESKEGEGTMFIISLPLA